MTLTPRDYQTEAVEKLFEHIQQGGKSGVIQAATGAGKSLIIALIADLLKQYRALVLCHNAEVLQSNFDTYDDLDKSMYCAGLKQKCLQSRVVFSSRDSFVRVKEPPKFDFVIVDECFVAGTKVTTRSGYKNIEDVLPDDEVLAFTGFEKVKAVSAKATNEIFKLEFDDGSTIECTGNHPIFTEHGWKKASELECGWRVFCREDLHELQKKFQTEDLLVKRESNSTSKGVLEKDKILFDILCSEIRESNERYSDTKQNESNAQKNSTQTNQTRRKWTTASFTTTRSFTRIGSWLGSGVFRCNKVKAKRWISSLLQNRYCKSRKKDCDRSGWRDSHKFETNRQKEGRSAQEIRMVGISRIKCESFRTVFNLHVNGHPSYFANGKLVHNCHLVSLDKNSGYAKILDRVKPGYLLGLTATPYRSDNGPIYGDGRIFEKLLFSIGTQFLIDRKLLAPYVWPEIEKSVDVSNIKKIAGDFDAEQQARLYNEPIVAEALRRWEACNRKLSLFFCCSVDHAQLVHKCVQGSIIITGETPAYERQIIIADIKAGKYRAIINVAVMTTGVNIPAIDCVVFMRATQSASLFVQMLGRGLRTDESKTDCLVLDFAGNYERFGHPDNPMVLRKGKKKDEQAIEEMLDGLLGPVEVKSDAPTKTCGECGMVWPVAKKKCTCGKLFLSHFDVQYSDDDWITVKSAWLEERITARGVPAIVVFYATPNKRYQEWFVDGQSWQLAKKFERIKQVRAQMIEAIKIKVNEKGWPNVTSVKVKSSLPASDSSSPTALRANA